jgi:hypothetical protein
MMPGVVLGIVGRAMWGEQWEGPMSVFLGVRRDTIKGWAKDRRPIPDDAWFRLYHRIGDQETALGLARSYVTEVCSFVREEA